MLCKMPTTGKTFPQVHSMRTKDSMYFTVSQTVNLLGNKQ